MSEPGSDEELEEAVLVERVDRFIEQQNRKRAKVRRFGAVLRWWFGR